MSLPSVQPGSDNAELPFRALFAGSPVGIGLSDEHGHFLAANRALCVLFGREERELLGRSSAEFTHPEDLATNRDAEKLLRAAEDGVVRLEKRYVRPDGEIRWAWLTVTMTDGPQGQPWTIAHVQDVTDRKKGEESLRESEASLAAVVDVVHRIQRGEDARSAIVHGCQELSGARHACLFEPADGALVVTSATVADHLGTRVPFRPESAAVRVFESGEPLFLDGTDLEAFGWQGRLGDLADGSTLWQPVVSRGATVGVLLVVWDGVRAAADARSARAVSLLSAEAAVALEQASLITHLESLARTDPLTGLLNRRGWHSRLDQLLERARADGTPLTVAVADLDHFKAYNDLRGHHQGDELLRMFAAQCRSVLRSSDVIARWGGEEFAFALPQCSDEQAALVLGLVKDAVPDDETCSIGYAVWDEAETVQRLMNRADAALYEAKAAGRNAITLGAAG